MRYVAGAEDLVGAHPDQVTEWVPATEDGDTP